MTSFDPDSWMWERARSIVERADRIQRQFFWLAPPGGRQPAWQPPVDVFETQAELWILVALPGVGLDAVETEQTEGRLRIWAERHLPETFRRSDVHRLEIPYGRFERVIQLPPGRYRAQEPRQADGCVLLSFTKLA
jgi:HSP20 family protein